MFFGCYASDGRLRVKLAAPASPSFDHAIAFGPDFVYASSSIPEVFVNGLGALEAGNLSLTLAGAPDGFHNGMPFTAFGQMSCVEATPDHFSSGLPFAGDKVAVEVVV